MENILCDYADDEFIETKSSLLITPKMKTLYEELDTAIKYKIGYKILLQGAYGAGKTTTLLYIGHVARSEVYVVFPIQALDFVDQPVPITVLIQRDGSKLLEMMC